MSRGRQVFYGWWVIAGFFVVLMVSSGFGFYAQSVFLKALVDERGWSTGLTSTATATFFMVSGLAGYLFAPYLNRVDVRKMLCLGAVISAIGLLLLGRVRSQWQLFAADAVFGVGFSLASLLPATTTIARWFTRRRSVAFSIASTGLSAGGILLTPFVAAQVKRHGIGAVTPWLAGLWVVIAIPVTVFVIRSSPADVGLYPDGDPAPVAAASGTAPELSGFTFVEARATRLYVLLTAAYLFIMLGQVGGISQLVKLISERVESMSTVSLTIVSAASVVGRLAGGVIVTRMPAKKLAAGLIALQGLALALFSVVDTRTMVIVTCVLFGLSVGNLLMLQPLLLAEAYGVREFSKVYSFSQLITTVGVGLGPSVLGVLRDQSGYRLSFTVAALSSLVAFALFVAGGPLDRPRQLAASAPGAAAIPR